MDKKPPTVPPLPIPSNNCITNPSSFLDSLTYSKEVLDKRYNRVKLYRSSSDDSDYSGLKISFNSAAKFKTVSSESSSKNKNGLKSLYKRNNCEDSQQVP